MRCPSLKRLAGVVTCTSFFIIRAEAQVSPLTLTGKWSASIGGETWDVNIDSTRQYSIWRANAPGDTLVVSMGTWRLDQSMFCLVPIGRDPICGPLVVEWIDRPERTRWEFEDTRRTGFAWVAYRLGYAPWDGSERKARLEREVYQLSDVAVKPTLIGCSAPLQLPPGEKRPLRVLTRFVAEPDSTASEVEVINPPSEAIRIIAIRIVESCRVYPGKLRDGRVVRVRVELPLEFR